MKHRKIRRYQMNKFIKTRHSHFLQKFNAHAPLKQFFLSCIFFGTIGLFLLFVFFTIYIGYLSVTLPGGDDLSKLSLSESTLIYDKNNKLLYAIHGEENREIVPLENISQNLVNATLAIEDDQFYQHPGFDTLAILRCATYIILPGKSGCGGSTLTQQFVKNYFLTPEKTITRKLKELILSLKLENSLSKDEILELYLNKIPYGNNAYGIQSAAKVYFSKDAKDLTLAESAIIAALPNAPTYYSPYGTNRYSHFIKEFDPETLKKRKIKSEQDLIRGEDFQEGLLGKSFQIDENTNIYLHGRSDLVLRRMVELEMITEEKKTKTSEEIKNIEFKAARTNILAPHFVLYIKQILEDKYGKELVEQGGLKVYTSLDYEIQKKAEEVISEKRERNLKEFNADNASLVALDPKNGQILAMVGGVDYFDQSIDGNVNVALRGRAPGSSFKPFVYALSFLNGYGPATILYDVETKFGPDTPRNFDGSFMGPISIRTALGRSRNIPAIKAYFLAGKQDPIIDFAEKMGITSLDKKRDYGYPLALGAGEVPLIEMVKGYAVFANRGVKQDITPILRVENSKNEILEEWKKEEHPGTKVLNEEVAFLINDILSDDKIKLGRNLIIEGYTVATKTGTSTNKSDYPEDLWTIGYTPNIVVGVWVGNTDGRSLSMNSSGYDAASNIFKPVILEALKNTTNVPFEKPSSIQSIEVSRASGLLPSENTPLDERITEYFASFAVPQKFDESFQTAKIDISTGYLATPFCPLDKVVTKTFRIHHSLFKDLYPSWEEGVQNWVNYMTENGKITDILPEKDCPIHTELTMQKAPTIKIISPLAYSEVEYGRVEVKAELIAPLKKNRVEFYLNDQLQYTAKEEPYVGYIRISKLFTQGTELKIKIKGYDILEQSAVTQITVRVK